MTKALLLVDVQNDFCPGGSLAVPEGDKVVPVLNQYIEYFARNNWPIFASRDWHPAHTKHFKEFGGQWPVHCAANSPGAKFHPDLRLPTNITILSKGTSETADGYSAFEAIDSEGRDFADMLADLQVKDLYIGGLATDYCVKASAIDALRLTLNVYILEDAIKGVNLNPQDSEKAMRELTVRGAHKINLKTLSQVS